MQRLGDWFEAIRDDFTALPAFEMEFEHLRAWQKYAEAISRVESVRLLWLQGYPAYHRGRYEQAKQLVQLALTLYEQCDLTDRLLQANLLNDLASCDLSLGEYGCVLELGQKALKLRKELFGEKHPDIATSINTLANGYSGLRQYDQALELGQKALQMQQELLGEKHPDVARSMNNLASYYSKLGKNDQALELVQKALDMRRELLGASHPKTISSLLFVLKQLYANPSAISQGMALAQRYLKLVPREHEAYGKILGFLNSRQGFRKPGKNRIKKKHKRK